MSRDAALKRKPKESPKGIRAHKKLLAVLLGIATLLGGLSVVLPRPTVVQGDPVDANNPFSAPFTVTNSGFIPLKHVTAYLSLGEIVFQPSKFSTKEHPQFGEHEETRLFAPSWRDQYLGMDDRITITPAQLFKCCGNSPVEGSEFAIVVQYNPWIWPFKREKVFAFATYRQSNGQLYWYSIPND